MKLRAWPLVALATIPGSLAGAQPAGNPVLAEQLFEQGRALAKSNDWAAACPKFEASVHYDPTLGTKLNLATCYEKVGKLASAWSLYRESSELAAKANDLKRRDYAVKQAEALEPRLPRLTINAPANEPAGFTVTRDGVAIDAAALGASLYIDPGTHAIAASAPGFVAFSATVTAREGVAASVAIPALDPAKPVSLSPPAKPSPPELAVPPPPPPRAAPSSHTRTYLAIGTGAAGVAIAGVGLVYGVKARSAWNSAQEACPDLGCTTAGDLQRGTGLVHDARTDATISTVLVAVGGAAIAGGIVLWLTAPAATHTETARLAPSVTSHSAGLVLAGSF